MNKIWLHIGKLQYVLEFITVRLHTISNKLSLNSLIVIIVVLKSQRSLHIRLFNNWISTLLLNDFIKAHSIQGLIKFKFNRGINVKVIVQLYLNWFVKNIKSRFLWNKTSICLFSSRKVLWISQFEKLMEVIDTVTIKIFIRDFFRNLIIKKKNIIFWGTSTIKSNSSLMRNLKDNIIN